MFSKCTVAGHRMAVYSSSWLACLVVNTHLFVPKQASLRRITNIYAAVRPFLEGCRVEECTKANSGICKQTQHKFEKVRLLLASLCTAAVVHPS